MSNYLVKRLRSVSANPIYLLGIPGTTPGNVIATEAADRIEELEAENKRLRLEVAHANDTADVAIEHAKELEAKLARYADLVADKINLRSENAALKAKLAGGKDE
jgi:uncharacterized secreted protein with C-terminal beta-propeller domain